jgi:hypothetical protein
MGVYNLIFYDFHKICSVVTKYSIGPADTFQLVSSGDPLRPVLLPRYSEHRGLISLVDIMQLVILFEDIGRSAELNLWSAKENY